jgi:uncharacterized damage-inducible protein DinB
MNEEHARLVDVYSNQSKRLKKTLADCPREMWEFKTRSQDWCIREVLHHVADAELNFVLRIRFALGEPGAPVHSFDQEKWGRELKYPERYPETAIELYDALVHDTHGLLLELEDADFSKTVQHPARGPLTVEYLVQFCDVHLEKHLDQIRRRLSEWKAQVSGKTQ